ncbi:probable G-protein coupled receptor 139 [Haliotis rufescens]|uniref:probable G-protein coupled receptor 139 n=1 Tax=Haliotis rufescens TaxID=6454 RepID=UPI00201EFF0A|nr:probable G-protein coupled receptor 139 [Haliotis rufescens]
MASNTTRIINNSGDLINDSSWRAVDSVAFDIQTYYLWVILALGFPGNCATIVTVIKMSPARSLTVYIALLAVVDNLAIVNKLLLIVLLDHKIHVGQLGCKVLGYFGNFLTTFANWLLVAMSMERFAAVWFPLKIGQSWTFKKSILAVVLLSLPLCILFLHLFWTMKFLVEKETGTYHCDIYKEYEYFMMHIWYWINILVYAFIPCILLLLFNLLIIAGIVKSDKEQKYLHGNKNTNSGVDRHRPITIMLVTAAAVLVVLTTPRCLMLILTPYWNPDHQSMEGAVKYLLDTLAFLLCDLTHAINFYVYSLSAKRFRGQFIELCLCRHHKATQNHTLDVSIPCRTSVRISMKTLSGEKTSM